MRQVLIRGGAVTVEDVPAPGVEPGAVLVRVAYSAISTGTETAGLAAAAEPLWRKALRHPDKVRKLLRRLASDGLRETARRVAAKRDAASPTGYACAGTVVEVGAGIEDLRVGDRVACAGASHAHHAEVVCVPRHLVARVPDGLDLQVAATATLGAIALQAVRRTAPALGEVVAVLGLGALGQLLVQLLRAAGARVAAVDLDARRVALARQHGAEWGIAAAAADPVQVVVEATGGTGADAVVIAAATPSDEPIRQAMEMARKKGRVVIVGDVGLKLVREPFYVRELDLLISTSYGPGRYDTTYETEGLDYPLAYVRWTENRNLAEYLRLAAAGTLTVAPLIERVSPVAEAATAFAALSGAPPRPLLALLRYPAEGPAPARAVTLAPAAPRQPGRLRLACLGVGEFAKGVLLPAVRALPDDFALVAVAARRGHVAAEAARAFGAARAETDLEALCRDDGLDAAIIATRHDSHAALVACAAAGHKAVYCEKPLALDTASLDRALAAVAQARVALMVGYNRRFAPHVLLLRERLAALTGPLTMVYRVNAGRLPMGHWALGPEGGGRAVGEACHMVDLLAALAGGPPRVTGVAAARAPAGPAEDFTAALAFPDGSVATLAYTSAGSVGTPKEWLEVHRGGHTFVLDDFRTLRADGVAVGPKLSEPDKGHREALRQFARVARGEAPPPQTPDELRATSLATFAFRDALAPPAGA